LTRELGKRGLPVNGTPLTVKEGRMELKEVVHEVEVSLPKLEEKTGGRYVIEMDRVWYAYPGGAAALKDISLKIAAGEFVAVMGRNASGKTTLVKHFNGLLKPDRGSVVIDGVDSRKATVAELARRVGFVFQNPNDHLLADTVAEEIGYSLHNLVTEDGVDGRRVEQMLSEFNLTAYRDHYPRDLSGGEKQRVALASVLAVAPEVLVLDEPTRGMEYGLKCELMKFLREYVAGGNTVVLVTHDVETAAEHAGRVILMSEGRIVVDGKTREVLSRALLFSPQINRLVQAFEKQGVPGTMLTVDELVRALT
jgi:energy-coupling factor transport system ATP-binding protein